MGVIKKLNSKSQVKQATEADLPYPPAIANRVVALYDAVIGSTLQVNAGAATHTSLQAAINFVSSGGNILVLEGTTSDSVQVIVNKTVRITGNGFSSVIPCPLNIETGGNYCAIDLILVNGQITLTSGTTGNFVTRCWVSSGNTVLDLGSGNYTNVIGE